MTQSTIAIIILLAVIVLFITDKIPVPVTAVMGALLMYITGIIPFEDAFGGFASNTWALIVGMMILGQAVTEVGLADKIGTLLLRFAGGSEKRFIIMVFLFAALTSPFFGGITITAALMPIVDYAVLKSEGRLHGKFIYLPLAIAVTYGCLLTSVGSATIIAGNGMLQQANGTEMSFFEPAKVVAPILIVVLICLVTFMLPLQRKVFTFEESRLQIAEHEKTVVPMWKQWYVGIVFILYLVLLFTKPIQNGAAAMLCGMLVIIAKCIDVGTAFHGVKWNSVFLIAGALGFGSGIYQSGAAEVIARFVISISGPIGETPFGLIVICLVITTVLSNFMSNTATATTLIPIALVFAETYNVDPMPFVLACAIGASLSVSTPVCNANISLVTSIGYKFKDIVRTGGVINIIALIVSIIMFKVVYFM